VLPATVEPASMTASMTSVGATRAGRVWSGLSARLAADDPALVALRRGARGALSFGLTVLLATGVSAATGQSAMSMGLGFSVSIFGAIIAREAEQRARLISTSWLLATAAASFCLSALIRDRWLNHLVFVALLFVVVYARRWGDRANAAGFGAFTSFFLAAFLQPDPPGLRWHLLGVGLAGVAIVLVQLVLVPQRPALSVARARRVITRQLGRWLAALEACCAGLGARSALQREQALLEKAVSRARAQLDAITVTAAARDAISLALFELDGATERLRRVMPARGPAPADRQHVRRARRRVTEVRWHAAPDVSPATALGDALEALVGAHARLMRLRLDEPGTTPETTAPSSSATAADSSSSAGLSLQTRLAIQASAACALAIIGGEWLSPERWYWAVITVFVMFTGTASRGDALYKSLQRLLGTVLGVLAGIGLIELFGHEPRPLFVLLLLAIFATHYSFTDRFALMSFFLTIMLALLFAVLGRFSTHLLWLRLEETAIGAVAGILVAAVLIPRPTHPHVRERLIELTDAIAAFAGAALDRLAQGSDAPLGAQSRAYERADEALRAGVRPWRLDRFAGGAALYDVIVEQLQRCSSWLHELSLLARTAAGASDAAFERALERERAAFDARLRSLSEGREVPAPASPLEEDREARCHDAQLTTVARSLHGLAEALARIDHALRHAPGSPLVRF
jgi:uncharacterized membrane protein YccC